MKCPSSAGCKKGFCLLRFMFKDYHQIAYLQKILLKAAWPNKTLINHHQTNRQFRKKAPGGSTFYLMHLWPRQASQKTATATRHVSSRREPVVFRFQVPITSRIMNFETVRPHRKLQTIEVVTPMSRVKSPQWPIYFRPIYRVNLCILDLQSGTWICDVRLELFLKSAELSPIPLHSWSQHMEKTKK